MEVKNDWREKLMCDSRGNVICTMPNIALIMKNDMALSNIVYNEMNGYFDVIGSVPWNKKSRGWTNSDMSCLEMYLEETYDIYAPTKCKDSMLAYLSTERRYHPIKEYLASVTWDGHERLDVQNAALVGNSFCGMATAKLADFINGTGCQSSLEAAYDLFEKAIEYYGRAFDRPHRDMINAYNKLVSCWVRIVDIKPAAFIADKAEKYMQVMLKNIYDVLGATDINKKEVIRSADNIVCILRHTKKQGCVDRDMIDREIIPVFEMIRLMGDDTSLGIVHAFEELCLN